MRISHTVDRVISKSTVTQSIPTYDILDFAAMMESDGNAGTGTLIDGDDIIFVFARNADGMITDSICLEDVIGDDGITDSAVAAFDQIGESGGIDIFTL